MSLRKLLEKVKKQQEKVEEKIHIVAKTAGMNHNLWVENADRDSDDDEEGEYYYEYSIEEEVYSDGGEALNQCRNEV
ncbi:hypothetical protein Tco_1542850, partial [Tanacetum coccineum]